MYSSNDSAKASIELAISTRAIEAEKIRLHKEKGIYTAAVDFGGNISQSLVKVIERTIVAAKRGGVIKEGHLYDGAVAGACREALTHVMEKANGLNVGGKIGIARCGEHLSVCIYMNIGLLHLNEVVIGLGHRSVPDF